MAGGNVVLALFHSGYGFRTGLAQSRSLAGCIAVRLADLHYCYLALSLCYFVGLAGSSPELLATAAYFLRPVFFWDKGFFW